MLAFAPLDGAVGVAGSALSGIAAFIAPLAGPYAMVLAIILFTVAVRLAVAPLSIAAVRGERRRNALLPKIQEIQQRYAKQPDRLRTELTALYRESGSNPLAGCLPSLAQVPFFLVMYRTFTISPPAGELWGVPLGHHLAAGLGGAVLPVYGVLLLLLILLAVFFARRSRRALGPQATGLARVMPFMSFLTVPAALVLPLAGMFYLVTTTAWTALEHFVLRRPGH
ncbi:YidC/Oxa1 family membrane protein insertase [Asanoa iriomotensis]|uniref:Membrane protein insertase YidC n=1 Tax=Asanoa iriomotensis TaxID=234613 RepID=A0ABQ4C4A2_9ACTN|nr:membrane protein insertase YidC [Asanoa iriomotensis]GIF57115.1 protein translocase component YidC [Asanoa iriomotensis]